MTGLPAFVYGRQKVLNEELVKCIRDIKEKKRCNFTKRTNSDRGIV